MFWAGFCGAQTDFCEHRPPKLTGKGHADKSSPPKLRFDSYLRLASKPPVFDAISTLATIVGGSRTGEAVEGNLNRTDGAVGGISNRTDGAAGGNLNRTDGAVRDNWSATIGPRQLPRHKYRIGRDLAAQHPGQQPGLDF